MTTQEAVRALTASPWRVAAVFLVCAAAVAMVCQLWSG
ncbi:hypothetical protein SAMN05519103_09273 [Rhizobiales bacterium GAS113]|nr:hypothetical protein SAMN05519103_09273 [Rhizobiales bacterium GAS113]